MPFFLLLCPAYFHHFFGKPHVATTGWIYHVIEYLFNKEHANKKQHLGQGKPITLFIGILM